MPSLQREASSIGTVADCSWFGAWPVVRLSMPQPATVSWSPGSYSAASAPVASAIGGAADGCGEDQEAGVAVQLGRVEAGVGEHLFHLLTSVCWIFVRLETPVATAIRFGSTIELDSMSSTQCPAVRTTRGATTVPEQA